MLMNPIGGLRRRGGAAAGGEAPHGSEDALQADGGQLIGGSEATADAAMGPEAMPPKMREHCKQTAAQHEQRREPSRRPSRRS